MMHSDGKAMRIRDLLMTAACVIFAVGSLTLFRPCGPKEDGSFMSCHWAGNTVSGLAVLLLVLSLLHLVLRNRDILRGLDIAMIFISGLTIAVPGHLISLCMMNTMRCQAVMRPAVMVLSVLVILGSILDLFLKR